EKDRHRHGHRELAIDIADRATEKGHRHEYRDQHHGNADDGPGNLAHGLDGGFPGRQPLLGHQPLDVFHHHNGVIHQDADHQHHGEHGQHVDGKTKTVEQRKGAEQRYRDHQGRNQGIADVLQEQQHHHEHQDHRLYQGDDHLLDGDAD